MSATVRTGEQYRDRLRTHPREVWLGGRRIDDVTEHPALRRPLARIAELYDLQHDPAHRDLLTVDTADGPVVRALEPPRSPEELRLRREAFRVRAEAGFGMFGRMPEFAHTTVLAFAQSPDLFARIGERFAENVTSYAARLRAQDLFVVPALTPPQIDRSLPLSDPAHARSNLAVVEQNSDGLVVRGARMLSTSAPIADEMLVYSPPVLRPGDDAHAAVFAVAMDTPGLRLICRPPFGDGGSDPAGHPLAAHFEEPDALVVFDDVLVPWDRVFLHGSSELSNALHRGTIMRELVGQQTGVRSLVRMELVAGVAMKVAETIGITGQLHVQQRLGEMVAVLEQVRALLVAAEAEYGTSESGVVHPKLSYLQALRVLAAEQYPKFVETLEVLGAGGLMMRPSPADVGGERAGDVELYYRGAGEVTAAQRTRLFDLAWDLAGTEFGRRGVQFERYGGGDPVRVTAGGYLGYDKRRCFDLVERAVAGVRE